MNKNLLILGSIAAIMLTIILGLDLRKSKKTALTVGIVQTISHPALDAARDSAIARLTELLKNEGVGQMSNVALRKQILDE